MTPISKRRLEDATDVTVTELMEHVSRMVVDEEKLFRLTVKFTDVYTEGDPLFYDGCDGAADGAVLGGDATSASKDVAPDIPDNEHIFFSNGKTSACDSMLGEAFDTKDIKTLEMELKKRQ